MALAAKLAKKPRGAVAQQKKYVNRFLYPDMEDVITFERHSMTACSRLNDFTEAVQAFLEKRPPTSKTICYYRNSPFIPALPLLSFASCFVSMKFAFWNSANSHPTAARKEHRSYRLGCAEHATRP